jgi:ATP-dependent DNA helicase DinG
VALFEGRSTCHGRAVIRALDVLGPGSPLSRSVPHWEDREGQLAMAQAVEAALDGENHLFVEAGTGTGKTLAYLVPAVLSGRKVIVSTATRALQEQIYFKDIPLVARALEAHGVRFRAALMKGLANYVCLRRLHEAQASGGRALDGTLARIADWARRSESGDRAELADVSENAEAWRDVSSSSETRIGSGCDYFERCFVSRMRREAEDAQIVIVNHHLFLADLALREAARGASVLPAYDAVVFDEAHAIEDIATDFFGVRVSSARVESLVRDAERSLASAGALGTPESASTRITLDGVREAARAFFESFTRRGSEVESRRAFGAEELTAPVRAAHEALDVRLAALEAAARVRSEESLLTLARRTGEAREDLRGLLRGSSSGGDEETADQVRWIEVRSRSVVLGASPIDVGPALRARLFDRVSSVVCTSATLATGTSFHFAKARLGAPPESRELVVASPFDFASRAVLYLPEDLPEPSAPGFDEGAAARIAELARMTDGGAFVLCTSTRGMKAIHARLAGSGLELMIQGEGPKHLLLERFRASGKAVLVATMSFWEGVDVPGWALRLVVLDKIPFAPPGDPVVAARCSRLDRNGGSGFAEYSVPSAAMTLKQGFGRLIRTQRDAGIVALLDRRVVRRGYGRALLAALPPARRVRTLDALGAFYAELVSTHAPGSPDTGDHATRRES